MSYDDDQDAMTRVNSVGKGRYELTYTDRFIYGTNKLYIMLSLSFNSVIVHGYSPDGMNISIFQLFVKNRRKSLNES